MKTKPPNQVMEQAMLSSDASFDGVFYIAVKTTSIFCRPSCPARKPLPKNVEYLSTIREALVAGYRPCKRCRPMDTHGQQPDWVETLLSRVEQSPTDRISDSDLRHMAIDPSRVRRYFHKNYGMTFHAYHRARRMGLALSEIRSGKDALKVALKNGYESNSGFRTAFEKIFASTPGRSESVKCVTMTTLVSPVGPLMAGATDEGVCFLEFIDRRSIERQLKTLCRQLDATLVPGKHSFLEQLQNELNDYFNRTRLTFSIPIVAPGTTFQELVWKRLQAIPYGETMSYEHLARDIDRPGGQRAVGRANGDNRLAIIIPCHRVVQKNGELRGYGGGLWRKKYLLDLERSVIQKMNSTNIHSV